jgi:hypothetical protein
VFPCNCCVTSQLLAALLPYNFESNLILIYTFVACLEFAPCLSHVLSSDKNYVALDLIHVLSNKKKLLQGQRSDKNISTSCSPYHLIIMTV